MKTKNRRDNNELLERAIQIAVEAHCGQKDRNGAPYVLHPLRMMMRATDTDEKMVAVLHDVIEESAWTIKALAREGFSKNVLDAVDHLTKRDGEDYDAFVERAASHPLARRVKILDLEDNMNVLRFKKVDEKTTAKLTKYFRAWHKINA
ncbi:MAG: GTP pyrophosphokinase [Verrucomicrobia bacterium]|nr:GTP pyrophosphokinase [Verrucomicrobiota bacterium]